MARVIGLILLLMAALAAAAWHFGAWRPPDRHNPWAPLRVDDAPNWLTAFKLARAQRDAVQCAALVANLGWDAQPLPDRETGPGCGFKDAWTVRRTQLQVGAPVALACPTVLSLAMWERHSVLPAAERHFGEPATRLQHLGSYACRNLYGREGGARSRHATAHAIDVAGFTLRSGQRVRLATDWDDPGPKGLFLHEVHDGACRWFRGTLGPEYNAAHKDHFHLETGGWPLCR